MPSDPTPAPREGYDWPGEPRGCAMPGACSALDELSALRARLERAEAIRDRWKATAEQTRTERDAARADTARRVREARREALLEAAGLAQGYGVRLLATALRTLAAAPAEGTTPHD